MEDNNFSGLCENCGECLTATLTHITETDDLSAFNIMMSRKKNWSSGFDIISRRLSITCACGHPDVNEDDIEMLFNPGKKGCSINVIVVIDKTGAVDSFYKNE